MQSEPFFCAVEQALLADSPTDKCAAVESLTAPDTLPRLTAREVLSGLTEPGRPSTVRLVHPRNLPKRSLGIEQGRAALVHAVAHIEFNAINLALDAIWRFRGMPAAYYADWLSVAKDEARHFKWLAKRLQQLGYAYGDFPAHNGLWEAACKTAHDPLLRMALVPRVLEARGLDVTPGMIRRLQGAGDSATVEILHKILEEEEGHVAIGSRWFRFLCAEQQLEPDATFRRLLQEHMHPLPAGALNIPARKRSGFSASELAFLQDV